MKIFKDIFFWGILIILASGLFCVMWMSLYPYKPMRIDHLAIDKTAATVGDSLCIQMVGEKLLPVPVHVSIELVNGYGIAIANYDSNTAIGTTFKPRCFNIPMHIETSTYRVRWTGTYILNEFRRITLVVYSEPIHITNHWYKGIQGIQGIQGKRGVQGKTGNVSIFGKGDKGDRGPRGK